MKLVYKIRNIFKSKCNEQFQEGILLWPKIVLEIEERAKNLKNKIVIQDYPNILLGIKHMAKKGGFKVKYSPSTFFLKDFLTIEW